MPHPLPRPLPRPLQDAQVTIVCSIPHEHHRSVLGTRGANVQEITVEHNVQIKFPERPGAPPPSEEQEEAAEEVEPEEGKPDPRDVINITGRKENCEAAKEALMVSAGVHDHCVCL